MKRLICIAAMALGVLPQSAVGDLHLVPQEYATIEAALGSAAFGDTVVISSGTYYERGLALPAGIVMRSTNNDPASVRIDGEYLGRIMECDGLSAPSYVQGVTFTHGVSGHEPGGAILCRYSDVHFSNVVFHANSTFDDGGAVYCLEGELSFTGVAFTSNGAYTSGQGGAIYSERGVPTITGCSFEGNEAGSGGAIGAHVASSVLVEDCSFTGNVASDNGGAIYLTSAGGVDSMFDNVTFVGNEAGEEGGAFYTYTECMVRNATFFANSAENGGGFACRNSDPQIVSSTFYGNSATADGGGVFGYGADFWLVRCVVAFSTDGSGLYGGYTADPVVICCDVYGNMDGEYEGSVPDYTGIAGNISADPEFCDAPNGDLGLYENSPCAALSSPCEEIIGAHGVACALPSSVQEMSWGRLKALYR